MLFNKKLDAGLARDIDSDNRHPVYSSPDRAAAPSSSKRSSAGIHSVIDPWLLITGDLAGDGELQVDGKVNGNIRCARLIVGKDGAISGSVTADEVIVRGRVKGVIRAQRVMLLDSARVESDIFHKTLTVEEGACFDGEVRFRADPMNAAIENRQIAELQDMAANMQASGHDCSNEQATHGQAVNNQPGPKADASPNQAFTSEIDRVRAGLREPRSKTPMVG
jgi:cytoskeletal protein CcmA (bactofilin family)